MAVAGQTDHRRAHDRPPRALKDGTGSVHARPSSLLEASNRVPLVVGKLAVAPHQPVQQGQQLHHGDWHGDVDTANR